VLLRYQMGFAFDEMAEICREKSGTLHARVARALPRLRHAIEAHLRVKAPVGRARARQRGPRPSHRPPAVASWRRAGCAEPHRGATQARWRPRTAGMQARKLVLSSTVA
jgi:hypothetical protein